MSSSRPGQAFGAENACRVFVFGSGRTDPPFFGNGPGRRADDVSAWDCERWEDVHGRKSDSARRNKAESGRYNGSACALAQWDSLGFRAGLRPQAAPTVMTDKGPVIGKVLPGTPEVDAFLGVPYAAPPVGRLRLRPPEPHARWTTPIEATTFRRSVCRSALSIVRKPGRRIDCMWRCMRLRASRASTTRCW